MNMTNIQTFLRVVYSCSLTQAANELFVSQPTVTARLQQLEDEVGAVLIHRGKGVRAVELTPRGKAFLPLAERWAALELETGQFLAQQVRLPLTIACLDSINLYVLSPLFRELTRANPELRLNLRTHESYEIYSLVEAHEVDLGFAYMLSHYTNVVTEPLFAESMVLIGSAASNWPEGPLSPQQLDPADEIYVSWSQELDLWHKHWWNPQIPSLVQVDVAAMVPPYLDHPGSWAICPVSVARSFRQAGVPMVPLTLNQPIPKRTCYMLSSRTHGTTEPTAAALFRNALTAFLEKADWLEVP